MPGSPPNAERVASDSPAWRRWSAIEPIFDAALDLPPNERDVYLRAATGDDAELRAAVEALLRSAESGAGDFTIGAAAAYPELVAQLAPEAIPVTEQIGPYRIIGRAGEGGMGIVYVAERADDQYRSRVALKLMRAGIDHPALVRRFLDERQILASLVHPGIARLYDGGVTTDGRPWFAMELVEGTPISHFCDAKGLAIDQRLRLTLSVCDAVAYAHRNFVIHRDLKPYNILVDGDGRVRVVDFGIAKVIEAAAPESAQAPTSAPALTPGYASPELLRGQRVTAATDVYSLGVILYRLLTGRRPYRVSGRADEDVVKTVLESQHVAPSAMALRAEAGMLASRRTSARGLARRLRGDLDAIVRKAMAKDPDHRYTTVEEFAADIRRHLDRRPVGVRPATWHYRGTKFVRRNLVGVAAVSTVVLLGAVFSISTRAQLRRVERERRVAQEVATFLTNVFSAPDPRRHPGSPLTAWELLDSAAKRMDAELSHDARVRAALLSAMGRTYWGLGLTAEAEPLLRGALELRGASVDVADRIRDLVLLTDIRTAAGDMLAADSLGRSALATAHNHQPLTLPDWQHAWVEQLLGSSLVAQKRFREAEPLLLRSFHVRKEHWGEHSEWTQRSIRALVTLYEVTGDQQAAADYRAKLR